MEQQVKPCFCLAYISFLIWLITFLHGVCGIEKNKAKITLLSVWSVLITEYHRLGGLTINIYFPQFWRLEILR